MASHLSVRPAGYWPNVARTYLRIFRVVVVSACVLAAAIGLVASIPWLLAVGICVGIGELLESSYYLAVLGWARRAGYVAFPD